MNSIFPFEVAVRSMWMKLGFVGFIPCLKAFSTSDMKMSGRLVFVKDISEQLAEFLYGLLRPFGVKGCECIDVVECVEQEVRVYLVLDVLQFRFLTFKFRLSSC